MEESIVVVGASVVDESTVVVGTAVVLTIVEVLVQRVPISPTHIIMLEHSVGV